MKTENTHNQLTDWHIEQLLKPCFAPSADEIRLPKVPVRKSTRRLWINIARIGGVAAALIVGLFIIITPNNTAIANIGTLNEGSRICVLVNDPAKNRITGVVPSGYENYFFSDATGNKATFTADGLTID